MREKEGKRRNKMTVGTKEAAIKTVTVDIKVLSVSGKQMTLAVFRQLQPDILIAWKEGTEEPEEFEMTGEVWGYVNYCPERKG
jgi:hypothetical protein